MESVVPEGQSRKKTILIVPATDRNAEMLFLYLKELGPEYKIVCIGSNLFGRNNLSETGAPFREEQVIRPLWLQFSAGAASQLVYFVRQVKTNRRLKLLLKEIAPSTVVIGDDSRGLGGWIADIARKQGVPTIGCQEGASWCYGIKPIRAVRIKQFVYNLLGFILLGSKASCVEMSRVDNALVWGKSLEKWVLSNKNGKGHRAAIIGDPRYTGYAEVNNVGSRLESKCALFMDSPFSAAPKGTYDTAALHEHRKSVLRALSTEFSEVMYRPHPLTPPHELNGILQILKCFGNVQLAREHDCQHYIDKANLCVSFPSTAILTVFFKCVPLIVFRPPIKGIDFIDGGRIGSFEPAIIVTCQEEFLKALMRVKDCSWYHNYAKECRMAVENELGMPDNNAAVRFSKELQKAINGAE